MGFDEDRFLDAVTDEFKCIICSEVLEDPMECSGCQTNFCGACIESWRARSSECPNRCSLVLQQCHRGFKNLLQKLRLRCSNYKKGCENILTLESVKRHEGSECPFRDVECRNCCQKMPAGDLPLHLEECPMESVTCARCRLSHLRKDAPTHDCVRSLVVAYREMEKAHEELEADVRELSLNSPTKSETKPAETRQLHYGVMCSGCGQEPIQGVRYMCRKCITYDLCERCLRKIMHGHNDYWAIPMALEHEGIRCDGCCVRPIAGPRYKCKNCPDFDFCHACRVSVAHDHNNFEGFLPYWVAVVPLAEERTAYSPGDTLVRSWLLVNLGPEVIHDLVLTLVSGDSCCDKNRVLFRCKVQCRNTFVLSISGRVVQQQAGTYVSEWKLNTEARVSFFGPTLSSLALGLLCLRPASASEDSSRRLG